MSDNLKPKTIWERLGLEPDASVEEIARQFSFFWGSLRYEPSELFAAIEQRGREETWAKMRGLNCHWIHGEMLCALSEICGPCAFATCLLVKQQAEKEEANDG